MNEKDLLIIDLLQQNGKMSYAEIGKKVGLSITAVNERIKKLIRDKVLLKNVFLINPDSLDLGICAFIQVLMPIPECEANFVKQINLIEEVQECFSISGEYSYLLKVRVKNTNVLEQMMSTKITSIKGVQRTNSIISLTSYKETTQLKVPK